MNEPQNVPPAIDLQHVSVSFRGDVHAVRDVSLRIEQGEVVALLGPNGAGKTTTIDTALGLARPQTGRREVFGMDPAEAIERGLVGVVNQTGSLPTGHSVEATVRLFRSLYRDAMPLEETLELTNLTRLRRRRVSKLSGGEQQRLRLALALLPRPLLVFLDEPTAGMDPTARQEFWRVMNEARADGLTIMFATHYLAEAESHAARTIIMRSGQIAADAPTAELLRSGESHLTARLSQSARERLEPQLQQSTWAYEWNHDLLEIRGQQMEEAARLVLTEPDCRDLRIADSSLEEIFADITTESTRIGSAA